MKLRGTESKSEGHVTVLKRPASSTILSPRCSVLSEDSAADSGMDGDDSLHSGVPTACLTPDPSFPFMWRGRCSYDGSLA